jgi:hypothetical protein
MLVELAVLTLLATAGCAPPARPIVAEVFYDAIGDDTGLEFVELYNPTTAAVPLAGLKLEAGDGAGPGRWTTCWTAAAADTLAPLGRFVIGGARVSPAPQAVVELALQNGPDAVRLVWPDGAAEVVGYGGLAYPEYYCGSPAQDVAAGQSLARVPDDAYLGSNALDFRAAAPSPGRANQPGRDLAIVRGSLALAPEQPAPGAAATLSGRLANRGGTAIAAGGASLTAGAGGVSLAATTLAITLAPGDSAGFAIALPVLPEGRLVIEARAALAGDEEPGNDADTLIARVGPGPLAITEIQFHPAAGEGEWIEVRSAAPAVDPGSFTLSDRHPARGVATAGEGLLDPDSLAILAQDRATFLTRYPGLDPRRVWQVGPWPSLNNTDDSTGFADAVVVREADGTRSDRVDYSAAGVPAGVPLERDAAGDWGADSDPAGTPLSPPRAPPAVAAHFQLSTRRLRPGGELSLAWALPWPRARVTIELYDLSGRRAAVALAETEVAQRGERRFSAAALAPGVYVVALEASDLARGASLVETRALRIDGSAR